MSMLEENKRKIIFDYKGKQYDFKGLQRLALEQFGIKVSIPTIQKRYSRNWSVEKIISTPINFRAPLLKNSILNLFFLEHNLTQTEVAHLSDISLVTLRKLVGETEFSSKFGLKTLSALASVSHLTVEEVINELMYASYLLKHPKSHFNKNIIFLKKYINQLPYTRYIKTRVLDKNKKAELTIQAKIETKDSNNKGIIKTLVEITKNDFLSYTLSIDGIEKTFVPRIYKGKDLNLENTFNQVLNQAFLNYSPLSFRLLTPLKMVLATHGYTPLGFMKKMNLSVGYFNRVKNSFSLQQGFTTDIIWRLAKGLNIPYWQVLEELQYAIKICNNQFNNDLVTQVLSVVNKNPFLDLKRISEWPNNRITFTIEYFPINKRKATKVDIDLGKIAGKKNNGNTLVKLSNGPHSKVFAPINYNLERNLVNILS